MEQLPKFSSESEELYVFLSKTFFLHFFVANAKTYCFEVQIHKKHSCKKEKKKIRGTIQQLITKTKKVSLRMEKRIFLCIVCATFLFYFMAMDVMFDIILCSFHTLLNSSVRLKDWLCILFFLVNLFLVVVIVISTMFTF